jgi:signal transduction histidine kinase
MTDLSNQAERLREQRRKFIEDVIDDLRPGLAALKRAQDVEGATSILSSSLEDLKQLSEISRIDQRIETGVVDLSELLSDACKRAFRSGLCPEIRVSLPELPTWVRMDAAKMDRALIQVVSKMSETLEKGQSIEAILQVRGKPGLNGIEIAFHSSGSRIQGAPEQEINRHWISQRGLALTLAQKVAKAHDGGIFASGLTGGPVQISLRFPKSILTDGLVSPSKYSPAKSFDVENFNVT